MQFAYKAVGFPGMAISGQKMTGRHMLFGDAIILQKCINSLYPFHQPFSNTLQVALHRSFSTPYWPPATGDGYSPSHKECT